MSKKVNILMVCLGNICRSPLAHGLLEHLLPNHLFFIDSAGTSSYHSGDAPDKRSIEVAKKKGIDISNQSARQFTVADFDTFDIIYAMDKKNLADILKLAKYENDIKKIMLFLDEHPNITNKNVPDPYYGTMTDFEYVYELLEETCSSIANRLMMS